MTPDLTGLEVVATVPTRHGLAARLYRRALPEPVPVEDQPWDDAPAGLEEQPWLEWDLPTLEGVDLSHLTPEQLRAVGIVLGDDL